MPDTVLLHHERTRQAGGVNTIAIRGPDQGYKETHSKIFVHKGLFIVNGLKKKKNTHKNNQQERIHECLWCAFWRQRLRDIQR